MDGPLQPWVGPHFSRSSQGAMVPSEPPGGAKASVHDSGSVPLAPNSQLGWLLGGSPDHLFPQQAAA